MSDLYYRHDWRIRPEDMDYVLKQMFGNPGALNYELACSSGIGDYVGADGFMLLQQLLGVFVVSVDREHCWRIRKLLKFSTYYLPVRWLRGT